MTRRNPSRRPASNGPRATRGREPVAKTNVVAAVVAVVLSLGAVFGLELEEGQVTAVVSAIFVLAGLVATLRARRSVTPNHRVE